MGTSQLTKESTGGREAGGMAPWAWERRGPPRLVLPFAGSHMPTSERPGDLRAQPPAGHGLHQSAVRWVSMPISSVLTGLLNPEGGSLCRPRPAGGFKNRADPGGLCPPANPVRGIRVAQICFPLEAPRSGGEEVIMVGGACSWAGGDLGTPGALSGLHVSPWPLGRRRG